MPDTGFPIALRRFLLVAADSYRRHRTRTGDTLADLVTRHAARNGTANPVHVTACGLLAAVLAADDWRDEALRRAAAPVIGQVRWRARVGPIVGSGFGERYGAAEIVGPDGIVEADDCRFGLFLMVPETYYPPHSHAAEELYLILSGTADWRIGADEFTAIPPGGFAHHRPWDAHATRTGAAPLLALWGWTGNLDLGTYRMDEDG